MTVDLRGGWSLGAKGFRGHGQGEEQMTGRIIGAIENPDVDVLAHPTCRLLPDREPVAVDMEAVLQAAAKTGTILEVNAAPSRLDLKDIHAYRARELGVKLVISTAGYFHFLNSILKTIRIKIRKHRLKRLKHWAFKKYQPS